MRVPRNQLPLLALLPGVAFCLQPLAARSAETGTNAVFVPPLRVLVDPRVELMSVLFRLAGNPEYNQGRVAAYTAEVEKQFGGYRDHPAVKFAAELRRSRGVSYDACMSMAVHLADAWEPRLKVPLSPWPEGLDGRWPAGRVDRFLELARQFVKDTGFRQFIDANRELYQTAEARMRTLLDQEAHLEWFQEFFGEKPGASFTVALGMLNGGACYGARVREAHRGEDLFCILGVWQTDGAGLPQFSRGMIGTVVHEFNHSYANPIVDRHLGELRAAGEKLYGPVADAMRSQAYGNSSTLLRESLVRAAEVRYHNRYDGPDAARRAIRYNESRSFLWTGELSNLLAEYESERDRYPNLESFAPRLVAFFNQYAATFERKQAELAARRPKVVALVPANGATNVDPALSAIQVTFDRPMRDRSWSMVGGGPNFPELVGEAHYDATRTRWSVGVRLKPEWHYEFRLNSGEFNSFQSEEGVALSPVAVEFTTGKGGSGEGLKRESGETVKR